MPMPVRASGAFHNEREFGEVVWRFDARASERARGRLSAPRKGRRAAR